MVHQTQLTCLLFAFFMNSFNFSNCVPLSTRRLAKIYAENIVSAQHKQAVDKRYSAEALEKLITMLLISNYVFEFDYYKDRVIFKSLFYSMNVSYNHCYQNSLSLPQVSSLPRFQIDSVGIVDNGCFLERLKTGDEVTNFYGTFSVIKKNGMIEFVRNKDVVLIDSYYQFPSELFD